MSAQVLFNEIKGNGGAIGEIKLNRPQQLNALTLGMVHAIYHRLQQWAVTSEIKAVVISAVDGRAFCAGGDIRYAYEKASAKDTKAANFFCDEYELNRFIYHFPKPYIALLNGITMGGGAGLSINGSHRVATENLLFAMPETGIGFFPDVGGTYFLPRLPYQFGFYLGLTGARINSDDCMALHLTQHKVAADSLPHLVETLALRPFESDADQSVHEIINEFAQTPAPSALFAEKKVIEDCFSKQTIEAIIQALHNSNNNLNKEAIAALAKKSPTSLKVTLRALKEGSQLKFDDCMQQELRLANHFIRRHDFVEGIRAVIIDKDQNPHWNPKTLKEVTDFEVEKFFSHEIKV